MLFLTHSPAAFRTRVDTASSYDPPADETAADLSGDDTGTDDSANVGDAGGSDPGDDYIEAGYTIGGMRCLLLLFLAAGAGAAVPPPIAGIAHIAYRVSDAKKAHAFYNGVLGLPRAFAGAGGATFYQVSAEQYVEILPGLSPTDNLRLSHIAIQTTDLAAMRRLLHAPAPKPDADGNPSFQVTAPEGTRLDFVEYRKPAVLLKHERISTHLQHTGVIVLRDQLDAVVRFYTESLGCTEVWRLEAKPGDLRLIKLRLPGARQDIIELMIQSKAPDRRGIGSAHHINFAVPDIHAAHRFLRAHGAPLAADFRPRVNAEDIWAMNVFDPDGSRVEVQDLTKIPPAVLTEEAFHGRRAWVLSNGWMRVSLLAGGGHIAEVRLLSDDPRKNLNPMRVPHYPTIEPYAYDDARDNPIYGDTPHRWLSSGYMGHLLCFPIYGPPSEDEARAGLGNHGEAPIVEWKKIDVRSDSDGITFRYGADLPKTQYRVERSVTLPRGMRAVRVEEWVENRTDFDRPVMWMQHATFGPPFIDSGKTVFDASVTGGNDHRVFEPNAKSGGYYAMRTDPSRKEQFFTMFHPDYNILIGYLFPTEGNPWIADWQENRRNTTPLWNGQVVARGIEFGSSAYAEGLRKAVERGTFRWIGARERLHTGYTIFLEEIPADFKGVREAHSVYGVPVVDRQ